MISYTDSKVVLGYITNESRQFYVYVANRVELIRSMPTPEQWRYVETDLNPADLARHGVPSSKLIETSWLVGPEFLCKLERTLPTNETFVLVASDPEVQKAVFSVSVNMHEEEEPDLGVDRFKKFSSLKSLQQAVSNLIVIVREFKHWRDVKAERVNLRSKARNTQGKVRPPTVEEWDHALRVIMSSTQREAFSEFLSDTRKEPELPREIQGSAKKALKGLQLYRLDLFLDSHGILRIGGRLRRAQMEYNEKHAYYRSVTISHS